MIEIREVTSRKDLKRFIKYPVQLYKNCKYYVPSLMMDEMATFDLKKNPYLKGNKIKSFLAYKNGKLVGRIAGLINYKDNELSGKKFIRFSRFECIDDLDVFRALFAAVARFGKENGMEFLHGPWGFNDTDREGMLTFGFNERSTYATNYYYEYFHKNMQKLGFEDESKWAEKRFAIPQGQNDKVLKIAQRIKERYQLTDVAETMSVKQILSKYRDEFFRVLNEAYAHLDGYVPIEGAAQDIMLKNFATIVNTKYVSLLVDKNDKLAAFGVCLPSICEPIIKTGGRLFPTGFVGVLRSIAKPKELEMALVAVSNEYKNTGVVAAMTSRILDNIIKNGIQAIESNPMLECNHSIQNSWKFTDSEIIKKRQTYKMDIEQILQSM